MYIKTAYSSKGISADVIEEIKSQLSGFDVKLLVFFVTSRLVPSFISQKIQEAFPNASVIGCTTAGEIVTGKMQNNSLVAMAFDVTAVDDVKVEVVENPKQERNVRNVFVNFETYFKTPMSELDPGKYVGMVFVDGLIGVEEKLNSIICDMTKVTFVGGAAGDDMKWESTYIFANGKSYTNAAVLAVLKPCVPFTFIKTQSFRDLGKKLVVTKAHEDRREVIRFNDKPAVKAYAELLGVTVEDVTNLFIHNPVGLVVDGIPYALAPQQIRGNSMVFYCSVYEGMELSLLEATDIVNDTRKALGQAKKTLGSISGIISIDCVLRTLELAQKQQTEDYVKLFSDIPIVGFNSYGEIYLNSLNQTAIMLVFK